MTAAATSAPRRRPAWFRFLRAALAGYLLLVLVLALLQNRLLYFPDPSLAAPGSTGVPGLEEVRFGAAGGPELVSWWLPPLPSRPTVLFFQGNAGNISHRTHRLRQAARERWGMLLLGYRGYGRSDGSPDEEGLYADARAALAWLRGRPEVAADRLVYHGESLGSAVALELAASEPPAAVVLEAPFASLHAVASVHYPWLPLRWMLRSRFDNLDRAARLRSPLLVVHGDCDAIVPLRQGRAVFEAASGPKSFLELGCGHNDIAAGGGPELETALRSFIEERAGS